MTELSYIRQARKSCSAFCAESDENVAIFLELLGAWRDKPVLGHSDWRVEHLRFQDGRIVATYDWDSLAFCSETEVIGSSAHGFTADWMLEGICRIPAAEDIRGYVADYEQARGEPFSQRKRKSLFAHCVDCIAYGARCAHSLKPDKISWEENTWPYLLKPEGEALLQEAQP